VKLLLTCRCIKIKMNTAHICCLVVNRVIAAAYSMPRLSSPGYKNLLIKASGLNEKLEMYKAHVAGQDDTQRCHHKAGVEGGPYRIHMPG
jgi:hypothetical protein